MSQLQTFAINRRPTLGPADRDLLEELRHRYSLAVKVGLKPDEAVFKKDVATIEFGGLIEQPPLTSDQITIWRTWLPHRYTGDVLENYSHRRVPPDTLKRWADHEEGDFKVFESFEIWSAGLHHGESVLVGVVGHNTYVLARWEDPGVDLPSWREIKSTLLWRHKTNFRLLVKSVMCGSLALLAVLFLAVGFDNDIGNLPGYLVLGLMAGVMGGFTYHYLKTRSLSQAIARDNVVEADRS